MAKREYLTKQIWWLGKVIGELQFTPHQEDILRALGFMALEEGGFGLMQSQGGQAVASTPPDLNCNIAPASYMIPDGKLIGWDASEQVDISNADQGTTQGPTAAVNAGNKRYVVVTGIHVFEKQDPDTDDDGNPVFFTDKSTSKFGVWMSQEVTLADVWYESVTLINLVTNILAAGQVPIALAVREFGAAVVDQDHLFEAYRSIQAHEKQRDAASQLVAEMIATSFGAPMVLNSAGTVAITGQAVVGQPGTVTLPGGELLALCLNGEKGAQNLYGSTDLHKRRLAVRPVPLATVLTLPNTNTTYVVRAKLNPQTAELEVYFGEGDYPLDERDGWNPGNEGSGSQGGSNLGFLATWIDMPLATVVTGAAGSVPTVTAIRNDHSGRLAYLNQQAAVVDTKADKSETDPLVFEYNNKQAYLEGNTSGLVNPMSAGAGLNLDIAALFFRGGLPFAPPQPYALPVAAATIALADNTINMIYAEPNSATPQYLSADLAGGGGPAADTTVNPKVILGFVRTSGGSIDQIVFAPLTLAELSVQDVDFSEVRVNTARELIIGPTTARAIVGTSGINGVYKTPWATQLDPTVAGNWESGVVGGNSQFHYLYADPGGSGGGVSRHYCMFKLSEIQPDPATGRHPTKPNLVFMCAVYKTGAATLQVLNKKGDLSLTPQVQVLSGGNATSRTAVALVSAVPETATHVRLLVDVNPLATVGAGAVTASIFQESTGSEFARVQASGESGSNASEAYTGGVVDVPIDKSVVGGQFHYSIDDASASVNIYVLGWREGRTQINLTNKISY